MNTFGKIEEKEMNVPEETKKECCGKKEISALEGRIIFDFGDDASDIAEHVKKTVNDKITLIIESMDKLGVFKMEKE